jgi:hypothetical protein
MLEQKLKVLNNIRGSIQKQAILRPNSDSKYVILKNNLSKSDVKFDFNNLSFIVLEQTNNSVFSFYF